MKGMYIAFFPFMSSFSTLFHSIIVFKPILSVGMFGCIVGLPPFAFVSLLNILFLNPVPFTLFSPLIMTLFPIALFYVL